jgi:hypothetical protein
MGERVFSGAASGASVVVVPVGLSEASTKEAPGRRGAAASRAGVVRSTRVLGAALAVLLLSGFVVGLSRTAWAAAGDLDPTFRHRRQGDH